ncbi:MAG: YeeE/YedE thiosulfate transporter family protein, partial [Candidatus Thioglobus sp.]
MELEIYQNLLLLVLITTFVMGWVVNKTDFCTMGAVSDWINMGSTLRLRSWALAICLAILITNILSLSELIDMSLVESNETASPPYNNPIFAWSRYILGGFIFGVGMTIGSGCGNKTLVRIGG